MKKPFANNEKMRSICRKCPHKSTCKTSCEPVKQYLAHENRAVFEKTYTNEEGQQISIIYSRPREFNLSSFQQEGDTDKNRPNKLAMAFSTENDSPFSHFEPNLKQTKLFVDKFFFKVSVEDLSVKYDMSHQKVYEYYKQAKRRVLHLSI